MDKINILTIGDPHFQVKNPKESEELCQKIIELVKRSSFDFIVVLGDILHNHESFHVKPWERATEFLHILSTLCPLYIIIGNHDRPNNSNYLTTEHAFNPLKYWSNTYVVDLGMTINFKGRNMIFIPYVPNGKFDQALIDILTRETGNNIDDLDKTLEKYDVIFAHQEFYGSTIGDLQSTGGDRWDLKRPFIISGHIHGYCKLQKNIIYPGTPMQHTFKEKDDKTVSIFTWNTISDKYPEEERIDLKLKKKYTINMTYNEIISYKPEPDQQIRIILSGTAAELKSASETSNYKWLISNGVKIVTKFIPNEKAYVGFNQNNDEKIIYWKKLMEAIQKCENPDYAEAWNEIFSNENNEK
jgi:DNA repair exonuclease SbcCD nuclease subunit